MNGIMNAISSPLSPIIPSLNSPDKPFIYQRPKLITPTKHKRFLLICPDGVIRVCNQDTQIPKFPVDQVCDGTVVPLSLLNLPAIFHPDLTVGFFLHSICMYADCISTELQSTIRNTCGTCNSNNPNDLVDIYGDIIPDGYGNLNKNYLFVRKIITQNGPASGIVWDLRTESSEGIQSSEHVDSSNFLSSTIVMENPIMACSVPKKIGKSHSSRLPDLFNMSMVPLNNTSIKFIDVLMEMVPAIVNEWMGAIWDSKVT